MRNLKISVVSWLALGIGASAQVPTATTAVIAGGDAGLLATAAEILASTPIGAPREVFPVSDGSTIVTTDAGVFRISPSKNVIVQLTVDEGSVGGFALDRDGNFFFSLPEKNIVKVTRLADIEVYAGTGIGGYSGDGGPANKARLDTPKGLAVMGTFQNPDFALYIDDTGNHCVRKTYKQVLGEPVPMVYVFSQQDYITSVAGSCGQQGYSGDGGPAASALLNGPQGVALDQAGTLYIADTGNGAIRAVDPATGTISTLTGPQAHAKNAKALPGANAKPVGIAVDTDGTIYYTDANYSTVVKISNGVPAIIAGSGSAGFAGDGGQAVHAVLNEPQGIAVDANHNLWIADTGNRRVREISAATGIINTIFGNGGGTYSGDGGAAVNAQLYRPNGSAMDAAGNLYIADSGNYVVRKVDPNGVITTFAGNGQQGTGGGDGGPATSAALSASLCVAVAPDGSLSIGDAVNYTVRRVSNGTITTVAGKAGIIGTPRNGALASASSFGSVSALLYDASKNLLILDATNGAVYSVSASAGTVTRIAGGGSGGDGGPATSASLFAPSGMALDTAGNLFIAELYSYDVRRVDAKTGIITTVAGIPNSYGFAGDGGLATKALLGGPNGVAVDSAGNLYIADSYNNDVRMVDSSGNIHTFAGGPGAFYSGSGVLSTAGSLNTPLGITIDSSGNFYIADTGDNVVRKVSVGGGPAIGAVVSAAGTDTGALSSPAPPGVAALASGSSSGTTTPAIAPGEIVTIYGASLGPAELTVAAPNSSNEFPLSVAGMQVSFNGIQAPVYFTSAGQAAAIVPYELTGTTASVQLSYQGQTSPAAFMVPVAVTSPGIFTSDSSGSGEAAALNTDNTINSVSNPVHPGGVIVLYATGEGLTAPAGVDGLISAGPVYAAPLQPVSVTIGGLPAILSFANEAPDLVAGVLQINAQVPADVQTGNAVPVTLQIGPNYAQSTVTIAIQ